MQGWTCRVKLCYGILEKGRLLGFLVRLKACVSRLALHLCSCRSVRLSRWEGSGRWVEWRRRKQGDETTIEENFLGKTRSWGQIERRHWWVLGRRGWILALWEVAAQVWLYMKNKGWNCLTLNPFPWLHSVLRLLLHAYSSFSAERGRKKIFFSLFQWCEGEKNLRTLICFIYMD